MHKTNFPEGAESLLNKYNLTKDQVTPVVFQKGETVLEEGYPFSALYFVVSGTCRIQTYSSDGKILSFGNAGPGTALGEMELLLGQAINSLCLLFFTKLNAVRRRLLSAGTVHTGSIGMLIQSAFFGKASVPFQK